MVSSDLKKVVIVDDSRSLRAWLRSVLSREKRLSVVGEAGSAEEARRVIKETDPDVITLDVEMPGINGLAFLSKLMQLRPMPVVMLSGVTQSNSEASITALSLGAIDCILKPHTLLTDTEYKEISRRVYAAACSRVQPMIAKPSAPAKRSSIGQARPSSVVLLGASTGGVTALHTVLAGLDPTGPPVVVVQHMPGQFLVSFAQQLDQRLAQDVALAQPDQPLQNGQIRVAPGLGQHTQVLRRQQNWYCDFRPNVEGSLYCPSVDALFRSAVPHAKMVVAAILTGLGRDGADGLALLRQAGAVTIGQDEATSVVYGMPKAAWMQGAVQQQLPLMDIPAALTMASQSIGRSHQQRSGG
ncbi:MAG: chemotaxis-specific protein-glutamate methyltransferase CheB [Pseudomonadota bacterium]